MVKKKCPFEIETTYYLAKGKKGKYFDVVKKKKTKKNEFTTRVSSHRTFSGAQKALGRLCK